MEVFRYITQNDLKRAKKDKQLIPQTRGQIAALPEDPMIWGVEETKRLLSWIKRQKGEEVTILIRFAVSEEDSQAFVQEETVGFWQNKRPLREYSSLVYKRPEVVVRHPIPLGEITIVEFPSELQDGI